MNPRPHPMDGPLDLPTSEEAHLALDVVGTVDPTGLAAGANAVIYAAAGDYANTVISGLAVLPLGDGLKAGKYVDEAAEIVGINADEVVGTYGPFHRKAPQTQTANVARMQEQTGEIWGTSANWGGPPRV